MSPADAGGLERSVAQHLKTRLAFDALSPARRTAGARANGYIDLTVDI